MISVVIIELTAGTVVEKTAEGIRWTINSQLLPSKVETQFVHVKPQ